MNEQPSSDAIESGGRSTHALLERIIEAHPHAKLILDEIGGVSRGSESSVDDLEKAFGAREAQVGRGDIVEAFKRLDDAAMGRFIVGRRTRPSRFRWDIDLPGSLRQVGGWAGGINPDPEDAEGRMGGKTPLIEHRYRLRPHFQLVLTLPEDLSKAEANRLADYIKTLPFE